MSNFDEKITNALKIAYDKKWDSFDEEIAGMPDHEFPEGFEERILTKAAKVLNTGNGSMVSIGRKSYDSGFHSRPRLRRIIIVAVLVSVLIVSTISVYAMAHSKIVYSTRKTLTEWTFHFQQNDSANELEGLLPLGVKIPEGYKLVNEEVTEGLYEAYYEDDEGHFIFFDQSLIENLEHKMDGDADIREISINGVIAYTYRRYNDSIILWNDGNYLLELSGNCDYEILLKMAESIE